MTVAESEESAEIIEVQQLEEAAHFLDLEPWIVKRLHQPEREIQLNLQVLDDRGETMMLRGSRVQHSTVRGPGMGPLTFSREQSVADARAVAMKLTWQYALWALPFSGSAGLISAEAESLSEHELRNIIVSYTQGMSGTIGPDSDVITPSRDLPPQVMAWAVGALGAGTRRNLGSITGKPMSLGGVNRDHIAGHFLRFLISRVLGGKWRGKQIALVGFDASAQCAAVELEQAGARVIAVSDSSGAVYHRTNLNVGLLRQHVQCEGVVFGYPEAQSIGFDEMLQIPCDVLVLSDAQELHIKPVAGVVIEAGGTVTPELTNEATVVPAILGNFGLPFADFLESRKVKRDIVSEVELTRGMQTHIAQTWSEVTEYAQHHELSVAKATIAVALSRVAEAMRMKR